MLLNIVFVSGMLLNIVFVSGMLSNIDASSFTAPPDPDAPPGPSLLQTFLDPEVSHHPTHILFLDAISSQASTPLI